MAPRSPLADAECQELAEELAGRMDLDDEERGKFIHRCMLKAGYKAVPEYVKDDDKDKANGNGKTKGRNGGSRPRKADDDDDWYNQ
jgi:hypothetical protein